MSDKYLGKLIMSILFLTMSLCVDLQAVNLPSHKNPTKPTTLATGTSAPPFDISTIDNHEISLEDFKGKVTLVIFWATWCGPCKPILEDVVSVYRKHHLEGFDVITFSLDKDCEILRAFLTERKFPWRYNVWLKGETENKIARSYGVRALPTVYLLGHDGRIRGTCFLWGHKAGRTAKSKSPVFEDAVKSLLFHKASNNTYQCSSWIGGVVIRNGRPVD